MPLNIIIPSYIAVLFCLICIVILNPETAKFSYPPSSRAIMYLTVAVVMLALLAICRIGRDRQYRAMLFCFSILASCSMISLIAMSFGGTISENVGNFPAIGSRIAFEAFIWTLVLANASSKHLDILLPSALYLTLVIHLPNLISGALLHTQSFPSHNGMQVLIIVGLCAIAVAVLDNVLMAMFLFRPKLKSQLGAMPTDDLETALSKTQQAVGLSDRQMDIVRYAYRNWTAQRIADELFISEGTVKTHLKTIYRKASVHSKQELIDLVDNYRDN